MNTQRATHTHPHLKMLLAALLLVLTANLASQVVSQITGLDVTSAVHACTNQGGSGDC